MTTASMTFTAEARQPSSTGWPVQGVVNYLPIIPGARGFGMNTLAGSGRGGATNIIKVTNLNDSGTGSLRAAMKQSGSRTVIFEVGGTITLTSGPIRLSTGQGFLTIAGQTAPPPGIQIVGEGLGVWNCTDVLISHLRIRTGPVAGDTANCMSIFNAVSPPGNVVLDHLTLNWSVDQLSEVWNAVGDVTYWRCMMAEALHDSVHPSGVHSAGPIFGTAAGRVSGIGNLLANNSIRQPRTAIAECTWVNNVHYNRWQYFSEVNNLDSGTTKNSFAGNVYLEGPSLQDFASSWPPIDVQSNFLSGSRIYVNDNRSNKWVGFGWELVHNASSHSEGVIRALSPPTWPTGLVAASSGAVQDLVLDNVGARPLNRDMAENRIIGTVRNNNGTWINCVSPGGPGNNCSGHNAGGFPSYESTTRALTTPSNPQDIMPSGYTKLEEWLWNDSIWGVGL